MWLIPNSLSSHFAAEQRCSMKEFASLCPRRGLWVTSSGKPLLREFSWRGWQTRRWSRHLFGADLLKISRAGSGVEQWTASLRDSRASRGAPPESSRAKPTTDGSGQPSQESSTRPEHQSFFLKMFQDSLWDSDSIAYSETLPRSGSMRSGVLFPQPTWEPPISANGFSFWPSTRAEDAESCGNHPNGASDSLTGVTRNWNTPTAISGEGAHLNKELWSTPQAHDSQDGKTPEQVATMRERTGAGVSNLNEMAAQWPTPTEDNANNCGGPSRSREDGYADLKVAVNRWPTAGANDHKGSAKEGQRRRQLDEAAEQIFSLRVPAIHDGEKFSPPARGSRQRLNPAFAAWLMGMQWWWMNPERISCAQSETEWWRCRQRSLLRSLLGGC
jgi:hypothetical protein